MYVSLEYYVLNNYANYLNRQTLCHTLANYTFFTLHCLIGYYKTTLVIFMA